MFPSPAGKNLQLSPNKWSKTSLAREGLGYLDRAWGVIPSGQSHQPFQFNTSYTRDPILGDPDNATKQTTQIGSTEGLPSIREQLSGTPGLEVVRRPSPSPRPQSESPLAKDSSAYYTKHRGSTVDGSFVEQSTQPTQDPGEETRSFSSQNGALAGARDLDEQEDDLPDRHSRTGSHSSNTVSTYPHGALISAPESAPTLALQSQTWGLGLQIAERTAEPGAGLAANLAPDPNAAVARTSHAQAEPQRTKPHHKTEVENRLAVRVHADGQLAERPCERCQRTGKQCIVRPQVSSRCATCVTSKAKCIR